MNNLKKVLCTVLVMCMSAVFNLYSQAAENNQTKNKNQTETVQTENSLENSSEMNRYFSDWDDDPAAAKKKSGASTFWLFFRMIIVLAIVISCIYGVMWFLKKNNKIENNDDKFLRTVSKVNLAPGKSVQVVTLLDKKAFVIGVADNNISLLSEFENPDATPEDYKELIDAMNLYSDTKANTKKPRSFSDILDIFMPNGPRDKQNVFTDSSKSFNDMVNKQRDRLNNEK